MTPRPSSAPRSSSSACSTAVRSESVACCSSRSLRGRLELKRIASSRAETSVTVRLRGFQVDGAKPILLADANERTAQQLQHGDEGHHGFEGVLRFGYQLHELDG